MKRIRHTPEQIIRKLREADAGLASGKTIPEVCKGLVVAGEARRRLLASAQAGWLYDRTPWSRGVRGSRQMTRASRRGAAFRRVRRRGR